jgi:MoaA/NifB/PqqE/SkfB family radical SAM enzyme
MMVVTFKKKIRELRGLLTGEFAYIGPSFVDIDVTRRCNLRCPGCRYHSPYLNLPPHPGDQTISDIPLDLFGKVCHELKTMGTKSMTLIGEGEPFLHSHLLDFISLAKQLGFYLTVFTNGTLLDETNIQFLLQSKLDILKVGLWASSSDEYVKTYPGSNPDNFKKIVKGLKSLSDLKAERKSKLPFVILHYPITNYNYRNINEMINLASKVGCNVMSFHPFVNRRGQLGSFVLSPEEEKTVIISLDKARKHLDSLGIGHTINEIFLRYEIGKDGWQKQPCYIGWFHAQIKPDGTVLPCNRCDLAMGNLNEKHFLEIWNDFGYRNFRRQTLRPGGTASFSQQCDCTFCCHPIVNINFHKKFRWISPFCKKGC